MYVHIAMFGLVRFLMALKKLYFNSEALYRSFTHKNVFIYFFQTFPALRYAMLHKRGNWYTVFYICLKTYRNYLETTGKHLSILLLLWCDEATTYHIIYYSLLSASFRQCVYRTLKMWCSPLSGKVWNFNAMQGSKYNLSVSMKIVRNKST